MSHLRVQLASWPDLDDLVAEIWLGDQYVADVKADGDTYVVTFPWLQPLPHRLESETSASWMLALDDLVASRLRSAHPKAEVKAFVRTGTGRRVTDPRPVPLDWG